MDGQRFEVPDWTEVLCFRIDWKHRMFAFRYIEARYVLGEDSDEFVLDAFWMI